MASAVAGIVLAVRAPQASGSADAVDTTRSIRYALIAALGFGVFYWLMAPASETSLPWAVLICRTILMPVLIGVVVAIGASLRPALEHRAILATCAIGVLTFAAIFTYAEATTRGALALVAVAGSLYPAVTMLLARYRLDERLSSGQLAGVAAVVVGVVLMAVG
jgi:drug/metabolite transporter (DMT)-like permease